MSLFRRSRADREDAQGGEDAPYLVVGLGNPGKQYERSRHNVGFMVVEHLAERWGMGKPKEKYKGLISEGRTGPGGPRVILLQPLTFMNESGKSAGPVVGSKHVPLDRVIVVHDEIDLGFGDVRTRMGGGLAGHNGLKSLKAGLGSPDFWRIRVGVDRPDSTDPERVAGYVLGRFSEKPEQVEELIFTAATETERLIEKLENESADTGAAAAGEDPN